MAQLPQLIIATRNSPKTGEIRLILGHLFDVADVSAIPHAPEIEETGTTFLENARLKALGISACTDSWVLADDSGLEVDALGGRPGVYSSSFGGEEGNHSLNNAKLLHEMTNVENRTARFLCTLVLAKNGQEHGVYRGTVEGTIAHQPSGGGGFGYDPLFIPAGHQASMAELGAEIKSTLSHRALAVRDFATSFPGSAPPSWIK